MLSTWGRSTGGAGPALDLNLAFPTGGVLDPRITFSRTTNATVTGSNGLIQNAPMNLLTFSEQFDASVWVKAAGTSISANASTAPDGTSTADFWIKGSGTTGAADIYRNVAFIPLNVPSVFSLYFKAAGIPAVRVVGGGSFSPNGQTVFNLSNGTVSGGTGSIQSVGNGWYRCSVFITRTSSTDDIVYIAPCNTNGSFPVGNGVDGVLMWGAQLELGSTAGTYNPTTVKNLLGYTEHFDNAAWTKSNASVDATKVNDIYGQPFAQKITASAGNATILSSYTAVASTPYTFSVSLKRDTGTGNIDITADGTTWVTKTLTTEFQRFDVTASPTAGTKTPGIRVVTSGDAVIAFGAQLSDSASVDPYVYQPVAAPTSTAYYGPRFDYDPVTLAPKGLLIEEQRVNLVLYSNDVGGAGWAQNNVTPTYNAATAPDATVTADLIVDPATAAQHYFSQSVSVTNGTTYTVSFYAKDNGNGKCVFVWSTGSSAFPASTVTFTLTTGIASIIGAGSASMTAVGNGWYRCVATNTATASASAPFYFSLNGLGSYTGSGSGGVYFWGWQLEAGAFATSYIPTVASQVTRAADSASMIGNNFARWYNVNTGTAFVDYATFASGSITLPVMEFSDGTTSNRMLFQNNPAGNSRVLAFVGSSAVVTTLDATATSQTKVAAAYSAGSWAASYNAAAALTNSYAGVVPGQTQLIIGYTTAGGTPRLNGTIKRIAYYPRRLANTELSSITS
jgi:hypothetical protein